MRSRKPKPAAETALGGVPQPSNYGVLPGARQPDYDDTDAIRAKPARGEYDAPDAPLHF